MQPVIFIDCLGFIILMILLVESVRDRHGRLATFVLSTIATYWMTELIIDVVRFAIEAVK